MAKYYSTWPAFVARSVDSESVVDGHTTDVHALSEFDKHRERLIYDDADEGWASELRRYLGTMQRDVQKDTDIVKWWQVSKFYLFYNHN